MLINLIEYGAREALLALIEEINRNKTSAWGMALIKRNLLKPMSNDSLVLEIKPMLQDVMEARAFALDNGDFYIAWLGMQKRVYSRLCMAVGPLISHQADVPEPASTVLYLDPQVMGTEICTLVRASTKPPPAPPKHKETLLESWRALLEESALQPNSHDMEHFREAIHHRTGRQQLEILVVEDQQLLRRMLHEILRTDHAVDSVATLHEGWQHYLERAPNIAFVDIGLGDGNGHTLAKAIKELDPSSCVVMVTANNTTDEIEVARENRVDGFVAKPYSKVQISKCINKYISDRHLSLARYQST